MGVFSEVGSLLMARAYALLRFLTDLTVSAAQAARNVREPVANKIVLTPK